MPHEIITPVHASTYEPIVSALEQVLNELPLIDCPALLGELERLKVIAHLKLINGRQSFIPPPTTEIHYLSVEEVAQRFHVTPKWLYRHKKQMPHSQPSRKVLLFPEQSIEKWFASRKG